MELDDEARALLVATLFGEVAAQRDALLARGIDRAVCRWSLRLSPDTVRDVATEIADGMLLGVPVVWDESLPDWTPRLRFEITRPGVYDLTFPEYLADPVVGGSLSSSGARMLLKRTPAHFRHYADHPEDRETSDAFDLGSTVHDLVFGVGKGYVEVKRDNWRTNAAKEEAAAARAEGKTPLLSKDLAKAREMAAAVRAHPLAAALFDPAMGKAEQTIVWRTAPVTGATPDGWATRDPVWCRALIDFLRLPHDDGRPYILPDLKTCESAKPDDVMRSADRYGYHVQGEFYSRAVRSVPGLVAPGQAVRFALVSVEKTKPYLVSVVLPDADAMKVAARRVDDALALYARCRAAGEWPGYGDAAVVGELPPWATRELRDDAW